MTISDGSNVIAGADCDFGIDEYTGYTIFNEAVATKGGVGDASRTLEEGSDWTASKDIPAAGPTGEEVVTTGEEGNTGEGGNVPKTGDISVMVAMITMGAVAFGGLTLKKRK